MWAYVPTDWQSGHVAVHPGLLPHAVSSRCPSRRPRSYPEEFIPPGAFARQELGKDVQKMQFVHELSWISLVTRHDDALILLKAV